jgi:toxin ParE1/3/4
MLKLIFHPDIQHEIKENYQWYEFKSQGLGEDFIAELESAFRIIMEIPDTWPVISKNFRRYQLNRFPFGVIYQVKKNEIHIVAVMHLSREPGYWLKRIES